MEQLYLEIGKIVNTRGLKGEVKVVPWADYPEIFEEINFVYDKSENRYLIENVKYQKENVILKLEGIDSVECAQKLKNSILYVRKDTLPDLDSDTFFVADLIGLDVFDENDAFLGKISDVITAGGADVYIIKNEGAKDLLLPALKEVVNEINLDEGFVKVTVPDGLL
ncbi:MAG: ribosome maturation factor RimM [Clostridia bacterium]|nr:ribosome maturation factor RimM [Oscillospiraceae bacterium]MDY5626796.1 ribosome maturation factor RimM [Clostridia bacterium]